MFSDIDIYKHSGIVVLFSFLFSYFVAFLSQQNTRATESRRKNKQLASVRKDGYFMPLLRGSRNILLHENSFKSKSTGDLPSKLMKIKSKL